MLLCKQKKNLNVSNVRKLLVSINVQGSAGPIRFIVSEETLVMQVIDTALKTYARVGRLPVLGSDISDFLLYCPHVGPDALGPWDTIGSVEARNFLLCKKPRPVKEAKDATRAEISPKGSGNWKAWFNKSMSLKISSH